MNNLNQFFRELPGLLREPLPVFFTDLFGIVNSFIYLFFRELPAVPLLQTLFVNHLGFVSLPILLRELQLEPVLS